MRALDSLFQTRERYYRDHGFADVFAGLKRTPCRWPGAAPRSRGGPG
jgi:hypothetical protein